MFVRISANREEFQPIEFQPGFNVILAERADDSTDQDSRNARGKSTLLLFINYVLAGSLNKNLKPLADDGWEISLTLEMFGGEVTATRALANGQKLKLSATGPAREVIAPWLTEGQVTLDSWKELLGLALFRLDPVAQEVVGGLSVRTLLSYVIRTDTPKDPLKTVAQQSAVSSREHIAYLLGLDWRVVHELGGINKGLNQLKAIKAATRDGLVTTLRPESDLILERAAVKHELEARQGRIAGFRVLEDPNSLVARANTLTAEIAHLRDQALVDERMKALYEASLEDSSGTSEPALSVEELFEASGAILADGFRRRVSEVEAFHAALLSNRREFLHSEIETLDRRIEDSSAQLCRLDEQRDRTLRTLDAGGALEELNAMRLELSAARVSRESHLSLRAAPRRS